MLKGVCLFSALFLLVAWCTAQSCGADMEDMSDMARMSHEETQSNPFFATLEVHASSGTDAQPNSAPTEMIMQQKGKWMLMLHGEAFVADTQQSGPRGTDKFFSANWFMPMAQRKLARRGTLTFRTMLSLEPATVSQRRYSELFQEGETAFGKPIVDGQHPHNLFMEIAALYDYRPSENVLVSLYAAPVGSPALGPPAYPHRLSASEDPIAPLGHHLEDSTHISDDVITAAIAYKNVRLEASGFHGREPDENRWHISQGRIDSWSTRVTFNPGRNWSAQYSIAHLTSLEQLFPHEDVRRMTASVIYNRPLHSGNWATMLLWGRNQSLKDGNVGNAYLVESKLHFLNRNNAWTRTEDVDRTSELLLGENPLPSGFVERYFTRVQAYTFGYDREFFRQERISPALGAQFTAYTVPSQLDALYGSAPVGVVGFLRLRIQ